MNRRTFLRLGALFVPAALVEPRRVYSFIWDRRQRYPVRIIGRGAPFQTHIVADGDRLTITQSDGTERALAVSLDTKVFAGNKCIFERERGGLWRLAAFDNIEFSGTVSI